MTLGKARDHAKEASDPIPKNADGTEFCLSYHVLGFCWPNCARTQDHRPHTPEESTSLKAWCDQHYV